VGGWKRGSREGEVARGGGGGKWVGLGARGRGGREKEEGEEVGWRER